MRVGNSLASIAIQYCQRLAISMHLFHDLAVREELTCGLIIPGEAFCRCPQKDFSTQLGIVFPLMRLIIVQNNNSSVAHIKSSVFDVDANLGHSRGATFILVASTN